jgi:hypothetical protein
MSHKARSLNERFLPAARRRAQNPPALNMFQLGFGDLAPTLPNRG